MPFRRSRKTYDEASLYDYAIAALGRRMRSVAEIKRLLRQRVANSGSGERMIEAVVARLKEQRYLNDSQYAATYSSLRKENDKLGRRRVISDLRARGVHDDVIDKAIGATYAGSSEEKLAREYLRRKRLAKPADQRQAARVFRSLARAGFSSRTIFAILKKWEVSDELLAALESEQE